MRQAVGQVHNHGGVTVRADLILRALSNRHQDDLFLTYVKTGPTTTASPGELKIIDAVAIKRSWTRPCITGYEIKVSRNDFVRDDKWLAYLDYCHRFYFACPKGLIQPEELPDGIGLVWYDPETRKLHTHRKASLRQIDVPVDMLYYIIFSKMDSDRHPFFSSQREALSAWIEDKGDRLRLATCVNRKIMEQQAKIQELESEVAYLRQTAETFDKVHNFLRVYGIWLSPHGPCDKALDELRAALAGNGLMLERICSKATDILCDAQAILDMAMPAKER